MHSEQYIADPSVLTLLDSIDEDTDILCHGEAGFAAQLGDNKLDPALYDFLNNNKLGAKLRKLIRPGEFLKDVYCSMGVLVLSRKAIKACFQNLFLRGYINHSL